MKIFLFVLLFFASYSISHAGMGVFLSSQNLPYAKETWTSSGVPDTQSSKIRLISTAHREEIPSDYFQTPQQIQSIIYDLFSHLPPAQRLARYLSFISFQKQGLDQYIAVALSPDTQVLIKDKQDAGIVLTPFESMFLNCGINIWQRRTIVTTLLENIHSNTFSSIDTLRYSNIRFWDCIIPFPDSRRGWTVIPLSFPSNKVLAQALSWNPLRFGTMEDSVDLISLVNVTLESTYAWVYANNLLDLDSTRIEGTRDIDKKVGKNKLLFVHQNHTLNPFLNTLITWNSTVWYTVWGIPYNPSHPLFTSTTDNEEERTFHTWREIQPWIYAKTLIQENTYTLSGSVHIPRQRVWVSTYYAIIYNYDISPPICEATLYSHESLWNENFVFPDYPWFRTAKYGYFVCDENESYCLCDSSISGCFLRDEKVLSVPQILTHSWSFQYTFQNLAWLTRICTSANTQKVFYDMTSPDVWFLLPWYPEATLVREYVSNNGILYNGKQIREKRMYHIQNTLDFIASDTLAMSLRLYDPYDTSPPQDWVSGIDSYSLSISQLENGSWNQKLSDTRKFNPYNTWWTIQSSHQYMLHLNSLSGIQNIITKTGRYQVYLELIDAAWNESRVIFYFRILPWIIDIDTSTLTTLNPQTLYANNISSYIYTLTLRDKFDNPIVWKEVSSIQHICGATPWCKSLRTNMSTKPISWSGALRISGVSTISNQNGQVQFSLRSLAPWFFTERFRVNFQNPSENFTFLGWENIFLKPYRWVLEVFQSGAWVSDTLPINSLASYRLGLQNLDGGTYTWALSNFWAQLRGRHPQTSFSLSWALTPYATGTLFQGTFMSSLAPDESHKTLLELWQNNISQWVISYPLWGHTIRYLLSPNTISDTPIILTDTRELQHPVKIIWNLQGVWNTQNLTERQNISQIESSQVRSIVRKNIEEHIKSRTHNTTVWAIKYIDMTSQTNKLYTLETDPIFETLIVRNGNIHIRNNFNTSGKKVGVISYIDGWYNSHDGYQKVGNIYVDSAVESISAFIYADGALISTDNWIPVSSNTSIRKSLLQKQLKINGSLFSRNTLAWGRELSGTYILPGNQKTSNADLAMQYDLYSVRHGNINCTMDAYWFCDIPQYLILEYDTRVVSDPPKLFSY
jgi:hypothetical protein